MKVKMTHQRSLTAIPSSDLNLILFEQKKKMLGKKRRGGYTFPMHVGKTLARNNPIVVTTLDTSSYEV